MRPLLTPEQMARADARAIEGGTPAELLMERAGRAVARVAVELAGGRYGRKVAIVCGKGNNGGDGLVAARALAGEGLSVTCMALDDLDGAGGAVAEHLTRWRASGGRVVRFEASRLADADVVVDAIFGTGFHGRAQDAAAAAIDAINASGAPVVAVDIPSGVNAETGAVEGPAIHADITVAMAAAKIGCAMSEGAARSGRVEVFDIGIEVPPADVRQMDVFDAAEVLPVRPPEAHKRSVGSVAVFAGADEMPGAAILTARASARAGAGYVTLCSTARVAATSAERMPEALTRVASDGGVLGPEAWDRAKDVVERADVLAIGPGLSSGADPTALVRRVLVESEVPVVLDADALNVLTGSSDALAESNAPIVITPHPAELARLLDSSTAEIQADRVGAARAAAARFSCVVILKGFRSVVADPAGGIVVAVAGGPELATAGTGDVLTGVVAALIAATKDPFPAAWAGVHLHGIAGAIAASHRGESGVVAWDVAEALPSATEQIVSLA